MDNLIKSKALETAAVILKIEREYKGKLAVIHAGERFLAASTILLSVIFLFVFNTSALAAIYILILINAMDFIGMAFLKKQSKTKLYADRLSEALLFSLAPPPLYNLVVMNFGLAILKVEKFKNIPLIPLKLLFLIFVLFAKY